MTITSTRPTGFHLLHVILCVAESYPKLHFCVPVWVQQVRSICFITLILVDWYVPICYLVHLV